MFNFLKKKYSEYRMKKYKNNLLNDFNIKNQTKSLKKENEDSFCIGDESFPFVDSHSKTFLVCGPAGSGKSLKVFFPNIIKEKECSMVILDRKNEMLSKTAKHLEDNNYEIVVLNSNNLNDNIFCMESYNYISNEEEIDVYLNNIFNINDEDDYYENLEVNIFKCLFKKLLLNNSSLSFVECFDYFKNLKYEEFKELFMLTDSYIEKNIKEFSFFFKIEDNGDFFDFKENFFKKYDFFKKKDKEICFDSYHFEYLRNNKVALFLDIDYFNYTINHVFPEMINACMTQMISFPDGRQVRFFLDEFEILNKIDNFERLMVLSRKYNYSIFIGVQSFDNIESFYGEGFSTIMANVSNIVVLGPIFGKTSYYLDNLFGTKLSTGCFYSNDLFKNENYFLARFNEKNQFENNIFNFKIDKTFKILEDSYNNK